MQTEPAAPLPIRPRAAPVRFDEPIPAHWFGGIAVATHIVNGVNLLFPAGERFFVRSVRHYLDQLDDPTLREQVKGFFGQEGRHAGAHERFFEVMEAQGYVIRPFLARYERLAYELIEPRVSAETRLSVTVALEHFTAIMAENALSERLIDLAHPALQALLYWHASEEIEHKSVAFDVLAKINPSYALRMKGLALATLGLAGFWVAALIMLLDQDRKKGRRGALAQWRKVPKGPPISRKVFLRGIREYARRDFHPSQLDNTGLAEDYLARAGLAGAGAEA
jgi:hypothetical protein